MGCSVAEKLCLSFIGIVNYVIGISSLCGRLVLLEYQEADPDLDPA
jgi:hypothetical protein